MSSIGTTLLNSLRSIERPGDFCVGGMCRPLGGGLWEVRSDLKSNRIARVLFCFSEGRLIALHGFIKKTQKTPDAELALARRRMREFK